MLAGIPGLSDIPVVGRLFAHNKRETQETDIILTLTPRIVRVLDLDAEDLQPFRVGRDSGAPLIDIPAAGAGARSRRAHPAHTARAGVAAPAAPTSRRSPPTPPPTYRQPVAAGQAAERSRQPRAATPTDSQPALQRRNR